MALRVLFEADPEMSIAVSGNVLINVLRGDFNVKRVATLRDHEIAFIRDLRGKFANVTLIDVSPQQLLRASPEGRDASARLARELASQTYAVAIVFEEDGFTASVLRSMVTTINLFAKTGHPTRIFRDLATGITWIEEMIGASKPKDFDGAKLTSEIRALRARMLEKAK